MRYYIGIDGGGTKTEGVLTDATGRVLARALTGPSNPNDITLPAAVETLATLTEALLEAGNIPQADYPAVSVFGGISGGINHREGLETGLARRIPTLGCVGIRSDVHILLSGELPTGDGACIICGTGSACFLRRGEEIHRIGGWGYLLDNGGSGYNLGRDALEAALRAHDGRGAPTRLTDLLRAHLGAEVHLRITEIYREGKPYVAACAPLVFRAAEEGDRVATAILTRNARCLSEYVEAAHRLYTAHRDPAEILPPLPVVMGGGISLRQAHGLWPRLVGEQVDPALSFTLTVASNEMVWGAVVEAAKQGSAPDLPDFATLRAAFAATYPPFLSSGKTTVIP